MRRRSLHLATSALAAGSLVLSSLQPALAQMYTPGPATPPPATAPGIAPPAPAALQTEDPPARVGRLGLVQGTVSFHTASETQWNAATRNYPVTDGNAFWAAAGALARVDIDASTIWLNGGTELDVNHLDVRTLQATLPQGEIYLHLRSLAPGDSFIVQTPRGAVTLSGNGRTEIAAGDTAQPTTVTVVEGTAQIAGPNVALQVQAGQTATITGTQTFQGAVGPAAHDAFLAAMLQREQPAPMPAAVPTVVAQMTGAEDLAPYGSWASTPEYGEVWYPQVAADWVPYRDGRWDYVAPWGWTWVDDAPWGFAPFHYGRWARINDRWGWLPVDPGVRRADRPVYSPALVTFFGLGAAAAIGAGVGAAFAHGNVGWVPLGPREPYVPPYRASNAYLERINRPYVSDPARIANIRQSETTATINNYVNHGAATVMPAEAMAASRQVAADHTAFTPGEIGGLHPVGGHQVIAPVPATRPAAPGPAVNPSALRTMPGRPGAPPLRAAAETGRPDTAGPAQPGPGGPVARPPGAGPEPARPEQARPEGNGGLPALRPPGQPGGPERPSAAPGAPERGPEGGAPRPGEAHGPGAPGAARPEVAHPEAGRPELPRVETPRPEAARPEAPRPEAPRPEAPRPEAPRPEAPRPEAPRPEAPRVEVPHPPAPPRVEAPRPAPRVEAPHPAAPPHVEAPHGGGGGGPRGGEGRDEHH